MKITKEHAARLLKAEYPYTEPCQAEDISAVWVERYQSVADEYDRIRAESVPGDLVKRCADALRRIARDFPGFEESARAVLAEAGVTGEASPFRLEPHERIVSMEVEATIDGQKFLSRRTFESGDACPTSDSWDIRGSTDFFLVKSRGRSSSERGEGLKARILADLDRPWNPAHHRGSPGFDTDGEP